MDDVGEEAHANHAVGEALENKEANQQGCGEPDPIFYDLTGGHYIHFYQFTMVREPSGQIGKYDGHLDEEQQPAQ